MRSQTKHPSEQVPKFMVRMPHELKLWIERQSRRNGSSQNSEIIRAIRERMERVQTEGRA